MNLLLALLFLLGPRGELTTALAYPVPEGVVLIAGWAEVADPLRMAVYSADDPIVSVFHYEGEAECPASFCVFLDRTPAPFYWFEEDGLLYGPIPFAPTLAIPDHAEEAR